ncbi:response regulator [Patescibacteria group bacterium]|nr:MAG: response regulator [Patescibacteria group bacterium]
MAAKKKFRVLIVEDDAFLAGIYTTKFSLEGFDVLSAGDGLAGLKVARKELPDIILLDVLMPKMDGFEVLDELKKDAATKHIPVVILTNLGQKEDVQRGLKGGAVDYLIKAHFVPADTVAKVRKILAHVS